MIRNESASTNALRVVSLAPIILLLSAACGGLEGRTGESISIDQGSEIKQSSALGSVFDKAGDRWKVPPDLLKALAYNETSFAPAGGEVEFPDQPAPWGLFGLRGPELERAARLLGRTVEALKGDDDASIDAAAALLDAYATEAGLSDSARANPAEWGPALERWGGLDDEMKPVFVNDVLRHLAEGVAVPIADGSTVLIHRYPMGQRFDGNIELSTHGVTQGGTLWRPSPNYNSRGGSRVEMVVIHTCEGAYTGCVSWLRNSAAQASAHYVVKEDGREISALVDEVNRAWHVAASYRRNLNGDQLGNRQGQSVNTFSVGIEHGGSARQSSFPQGQINASVNLVRAITARHNIPRDRYHIVAHGRLQPEDRIDPGPNWPWTSYIQAIAAGGATSPPPPGGGHPPGGGTPPPPQQGTIVTVDNTTAGRFRASAHWATSTWAAGKIGPDYRYRAAQHVSDPASYKVAIAHAGRYEVFARVPGNGYNSDIPYMIQHRGGTTTVRKNVSAHGASWMSLGTYDFDAKDDWIVQISCWTNGSGWVVADAIKLERR